MSPQHKPDRPPLWQTAGRLEPEVQRDHGGLPIQCQFCVGRNFRRSRLRMSDLSAILLMRYPVRCTRCGQRQAASFIVAGAAIPSYIRSRGRAGAASGRSSGNSATVPPAHRHKEHDADNA